MLKIDYFSSGRFKNKLIGNYFKNSVKRNLMAAGVKMQKVQPSMHILPAEVQAIELEMD